VKTRWASLPLVLILSLLTMVSATAWAESIKIIEVTPLDFGYILGAPGKYEAKQPATVRFIANVPVTVTLQAEPLEYAEKPSFGSLVNTEKAALDVSYWVAGTEEKPTQFAANQWRTFSFAGSEKVRELEIYGVVYISEIHGQPAGPYKGSITVTISAAQGGG
jgi:hypothetical protein